MSGMKNNYLGGKRKRWDEEWDDEKLSKGKGGIRNNWAGKGKDGMRENDLGKKGKSPSSDCGVCPVMCVCDKHDDANTRTHI
jgi:hypothetical protein